MKKKKVLCGVLILIVVLLVVAWTQIPKNLADLMRGNKKSPEFYTTYKTIENGDFISPSLYIRDPEGVEAVKKALEETEISFERICWYTNYESLEEGDVWYEVEQLHNYQWIQVMSEGKVRSGNLPLTYRIEIECSISEEERQEFAVAMDEIRETYGEENK